MSEIKKFVGKRIVGEDEDRLDNLLHSSADEGDDKDGVEGATRVVGPRVALKFLVSNNLAGALIGKGGAAVNSLQQETGARVKVSQSTDLYPGTQERVVLVTGAESTVIYASSRICDRASEIEQNRTEGVVSIKILIPAAACGLLIGRAGAHIKLLSEESGARVRLSPKQDATFTLERIMIITGDVEECSKCISLVLGKLLEDATVGTYHNMSTSYSRVLPLLQQQLAVSGMTKDLGLAHDLNGVSDTISASTTIQMAIPDHLIGNILGKRGQTISEIQALSGAKVSVSARGEFVPGTTNRSITISGSTTSAQMAQFFINNKLSSASSSFRGHGSSGRGRGVGDVAATVGTTNATEADTEEEEA